MADADETVKLLTRCAERAELADAYMHFQSMFSHRGDGIPTQFNFDEKTRDAARVLMAVARALPAQQSAVDEEAVQRLQDHMEQFHGVCLKASEWSAAAAAMITASEKGSVDAG